MGGPAPETRRVRRRMVVRQLVNRGIRDARVLGERAGVPGEWFLPPPRARDANEDAPLPIGSGQTISQPLIVALMTEALAPRRGERVLEIGTGSGYQTAILAHLGARVYTIERLPDLLVEAEERFRRLGLRNIETKLGDGAGGWPERAPFDRNIVTAAAPGIPTPLTEQLGPGGRLAIPVGDLTGQELVILRRGPEGSLTERHAGGVRFVPLISRLAFTEVLTRCRALGIPWVVSHPGNYIDDQAAGLERNAEGYARCLAAVSGEVGVLSEGTGGSGTALGRTFEELAALRRALPAALQARVAFCLDTAHLYAAGYDVAAGLGGVWDRFDRVVGLDLLKCLHLNDSKSAAGSRVDRHQWIGEGTIGPEAFRQIMRDLRLASVIKIIETPKGDDPVYHDRRMLRRLRAYQRAARRNGRPTRTVGRA